MEMNRTYQDAPGVSSVHGDGETARWHQQHKQQEEFHSPFSMEYEKQRKNRQCLIVTIILVLCVLMGGSIIGHKGSPPEHGSGTTSSSTSSNGIDDSSTTTRPDDKPKADKVPKDCQTTLLLMRHCEKYGSTVEDDQGNYHCSRIGRQRAQYLATLFGDDNKWPAPSRLFALTADRDDHMNYRQWETLHPLSKQTGVKVEFQDKTELASTFLDLLPTLCGQVSVVSWKHSYMHELAMDLGCGEEEGCPEDYDEYDYDSIWELEYVYEPHLEQMWLEDERDQDEISKKAMGHGSGSKNNNHKGLRRRRLSATKLPKGWALYATVVHQDFDPLAFHHKHKKDEEEASSP